MDTTDEKFPQNFMGGGVAAKPFTSCVEVTVPGDAHSEGDRDESPSDELARLIIEQKRDDSYLQKSEPFTIHFGAVGLNEEDIFEVLDLGRVVDYTRGCTIHGKLYWRAQPSGRYYCVECNKQYQNDRRRAKGIQPRLSCSHGLRTRTECVICKREMKKKARKQWLQTPKGKAYKKRHGKTPEQRHAQYERDKLRDPEYLEKQRVRNKAYRDKNKDKEKLRDRKYKERVRHAES